MKETVNKRGLIILLPLPKEQTLSQLVRILHEQCVMAGRE